MLPDEVSCSLLFCPYLEFNNSKIITICILFGLYLEDLGAQNLIFNVNGGATCTQVSS